MSRTTPTDRRLYLLVAVGACLGAVALAVSLADLTGATGTPVAAPSWLWLVAYTLLVTGSVWLHVGVRIRSTFHVVTWADAVILVGLAVMPAPWVVLATAAGVLIARVTRRSQPLKVVFAVAQESTVAFVGGLVLLGSGELGSRGTAWGMTWLVVAYLAMTLTNMLLVRPVVAVASRTSVRDRLLANGDIALIALVGRLVVALVAVLVLERQPQLVYALPLLVLLGHVWHEQWLRAREERRAWQQHATVTASFSHVDLDTVLRRAATGGVRLFSVEALEVELWLAPPQRLVRAGPDGVTFDGDPADAPPEPELVTGYEMTLHGVPGQPDIGTLRLRLRYRVKLSEREDAMLATFAAALETAVRNATMYGLLRRAGSATVD